MSGMLNATERFNFLSEKLEGYKVNCLKYECYYDEEINLCEKHIQLHVDKLKEVNLTNDY